MTNQPTPYSVILADPPWLYNNYGAGAGKVHARARGAAKHYPTQPIGTLAAMPVATLAADPCALFLWATWPTIQDAFTLIAGWGFTYKTIAWVWIKTNRRSGSLFSGMGSYTRGNSEPCLLAWRGKPARPAVRNVLSVIVAPVGKHSAKPIEQYDRIEALYPDARRIELFARDRRPGWDAFGNEIAGGVDLEAMATQLGQQHGPEAVAI